MSENSVMYLSTLLNGGKWILCTIQIHSDIKSLKKRLDFIDYFENLQITNWAIYQIVIDSECAPLRLKRDEVIYLIDNLDEEKDKENEEFHSNNFN